MLKHPAYKGLRGSWEALSEGVAPRPAALTPLDPSRVTTITSNSPRVFVAALFLLLVLSCDHDAFVNAATKCRVHSTYAIRSPWPDVDPSGANVGRRDGSRVPDP